MLAAQALKLQRKVEEEHFLSQRSYIASCKHREHIQHHMQGLGRSCRSNAVFQKASRFDCCRGLQALQCSINQADCIMSCLLHCRAALYVSLQATCA